MAEIAIWPGSSSFGLVSDPTPFGFYDYDEAFREDSDKVAHWCVQRLGYPLVDIELQDINLYSCFEEAVNEYGSQLYHFQIINSFHTLEGTSTGSNLNNSIITPNLGAIIKMSEQYGAEAGTGGNVPWYKGSIPLTSSIQDYDLKTWAKKENITGSIEIKRVFYQEPVPASARYLAPFDGFGFGGVAAAGLMEMGGFGGGMGYLMMPLSYDMQVIQSIEMNQQVRWSNYSIEIKNDKAYATGAKGSSLAAVAIKGPPIKNQNTYTFGFNRFVRRPL